ncbi:hypothetical protein SprV_0100233700 [Sparganum proliferum]
MAARSTEPGHIFKFQEAEILARGDNRFYNEPDGPNDNLQSQLSKAILNNFQDWRRWISYALSVLKTFDEYGLNRVQKEYGYIWRTQALELSASLIERKMTAERCIHEALVNLRSAFDNSCSTTGGSNGEGRPKSGSAEAAPGEDPSTKVRNSIEVLEESLNEESTTLLGDNGVANCCTNVNKNLHLIVTNLIPIRHPCPTKSAAPETDAEASRNLLERLKLKAESCIQDLVSALRLIEASMREVDFSEYLHFHPPREDTTRDKGALWIDDGERQKPANGSIKPVYENEVYCAKKRLDMSHFQTISNSTHEALDQWSRAASSLVNNDEVTIGKEQVADLYGLSTDHLSPHTPSKESTWQESDAVNELNYVDHRDTTLRRRLLLQNEARSPARVEACGAVLKNVTSVLETDLAYQLQCSLPGMFGELKAITEANLQLDTQLINAEAELKSLRDENSLYSAELLRVEYEIGAVLGTTELITAMASEF